MDDNVDLRRNWRTNWLSSIQEFADEETQRRAWLNPNNDNPHYSFVECVCSYFDNLGLSDGYEGRLAEGFVDNEEVAAVADFHAYADAYKTPKGDYDQEAILVDPKWAEVVGAAQRARTKLLALLEDASERNALTDPGPYARAAILST